MMNVTEQAARLPDPTPIRPESQHEPLSTDEARDFPRVVLPIMEGCKYDGIGLLVVAWGKRYLISGFPLTEWRHRSDTCPPELWAEIWEEFGKWLADWRALRAGPLKHLTEQPR